MPKRSPKIPLRKRKLNRRPIGLIMIILAWSLAMGWLLALATNVQGQTPALNSPTNNIGTVDVVPTQYKLGQELYRENCSSCHIAIPPAVFPTQTWRDLLQDSEHYGTRITPLVDPQRMLVWRYLSTFSRPINQGESIPYRFRRSRFFQALHPDVKFNQPIHVSSCIQCHPQVNLYNFRQLSPEWGN